MILRAMPSPILATFLIYLTLIFINYFREQLQRRRIRTAFGQYPALPLVEQLAHLHEKLVFGGENHDLTIMFSDVCGVTTISEIYKDDPQGLTSLINHFLTPMTIAIIDCNGNINKYIGEAIMAFWNAPLHDLGHEFNACEAALDMLNRVETLNRGRKRAARESGQKFIPIKIGVGINTDRCVVGYMGSDLRSNYSVLGDAVYLASRLAGQTKSYDVPIVIGSRTAQTARGKYAVLELDCITIKGKTELENIFTILGSKDVAQSDNFKPPRCWRAIAGAISQAPKRSSPTGVRRAMTSIFMGWPSSMPSAAPPSCASRRPRTGTACSPCIPNSSSPHSLVA